MRPTVWLLRDHPYDCCNKRSSMRTCFPIFLVILFRKWHAVLLRAFGTIQGMRLGLKWIEVQGSCLANSLRRVAATSAMEAGLTGDEIQMLGSWKLYSYRLHMHPNKHIQYSSSFSSVPVWSLTPERHNYMGLLDGWHNYAFFALRSLLGFHEPLEITATNNADRISTGTSKQGFKELVALLTLMLRTKLGNYIIGESSPLPIT